MDGGLRYHLQGRKRAPADDGGAAPPRGVPSAHVGVPRTSAACRLLTARGTRCLPPPLGRPQTRTGRPPAPAGRPARGETWRRRTYPPVRRDLQPHRSARLSQPSLRRAGRSRGSILARAWAWVQPPEAPTRRALCDAGRTLTPGTVPATPRQVDCHKLIESRRAS